MEDRDRVEIDWVSAEARPARTPVFSDARRCARCRIERLQCAGTRSDSGPGGLSRWRRRVVRPRAPAYSASRYI